MHLVEIAITELEAPSVGLDQSAPRSETFRRLEGSGQFGLRPLIRTGCRHI